MNTLQIFQAIAAQLDLRKARALDAGASGFVLKGIEDEVVGAVMREARGRTNPAFLRSLVSACLDDDPSGWPDPVANADSGFLVVKTQRDEARQQLAEARQHGIEGWNEVDTARNQRDDAKKALTRLEAATQLCARGQAFWLLDLNGTPQLCIGFTDLFAPGPGSYDVELDQAPEALVEFYTRGRRGLLEWVARQRGQPIRAGVLEAQSL